MEEPNDPDLDLTLLKNIIPGSKIGTKRNCASKIPTRYDSGTKILGLTDLNQSDDQLLSLALNEQPLESHG